MSDTIFYGKRSSGAFKSVVMYAGISACMGIGMSFMDMTEEKWSAMWWMQKTGWAFMLIGNTLNTIKAATSASTRKETAGSER